MVGGTNAPYETSFSEEIGGKISNGGTAKPRRGAFVANAPCYYLRELVSVHDANSKWQMQQQQHHHGSRAANETAMGVCLRFKQQ